jgi:hypothetical protein
MKPGIYSNDFAGAFSRLLEETGISCYQIYQYTHLDQAYLSRLRTGEKGNPSPQSVMKISLAFAHLGKDVNLLSIEKLFNAVGRSIRIK